MKTIKVKFCVILLFCSYSFLQGQTATKGTEFWLGYMENLDLAFNLSPEFYIQVYSETSGTGTFEAPASPGLEFDFDYVGGQIKKVALPQGILYALGSEEIKNFGLKITTSTPVEMSAIHFRNYFNEASILLPLSMLGSNYRVVAVTDIDLTGGSYSSFVVIATEDDTVVEITPSALTLGFHAPNNPFTIELNAGESYQVQAIGDLSGTMVNATNGKKLAVFGGARQANVYCEESADSHVWDQIYPNELLGKEYALVPFMGQGISVVKVVAYEDDTAFTIGDDVQTPLQAGEHLEYALTEPKVLIANHPVQVGLINPSEGCTTGDLGDPNMVILPSTNNRTFQSKFWSENLFGGNSHKHFVTLIAFTENPSVSLDGQEVGNQFIPFQDTSGYSYYEVELAEGSHELISTNGILGYAYGFTAFDAYTYHIGYESLSVISSSAELGSSAVMISPNPVNDIFNIENNSSKYLHLVSLYDLQGNRIKEWSSIRPGQHSKLNISNFPSGLYVLTYQTDGQLISQKIIKR